MIAGLIVGHGDFGMAIQSALESISGESEKISFISNKGLSTKELAENIKAFTTNIHDEGLIIFVDVYGGSCWRAAKMAKSPKSYILTGLNLPMLLSFIHKRKIFSFDDLPGVLDTDGKRGITSE